MLGDRFTKTLSDFTVGTVIVLVHVALADRHARARPAPQVAMPDGTRVWRSQISP
jgi:hypothetical protein